MASVKQFQVTFDCAEPERVARFWCEVLGYVPPQPPEGFATWEDFNRTLPPGEQGAWSACANPTGAGPRLYFQRVPEGKVVKNRRLAPRSARRLAVPHALQGEWGRMRQGTLGCCHQAMRFCLLIQGLGRQVDTIRPHDRTRHRINRKLSGIRTVVQRR